MKIDTNKVSQIVRMVDTLKQLQNITDEITEEQLEGLLGTAIAVSNADLTQEEIIAAKKDLTYKYRIYTDPGESIVNDYDQEKWYDEVKDSIDTFFWTRYKNYLIDHKNFSPNVVSTLGEDTLDQKLMNCLGNPESEVGFFKRGLIIGDVQSGKTSTYIGLMCKAADAGYKIFILLTGTIESLRRQTQERVEEGFVGINMADGSKKRVGVGLDNKPIKAATFTSRLSDFTGDSDLQAIPLMNDSHVVFVIKKNAAVLNKLTDWLSSDLNTNPLTHKIDFPMLLIDDEADNASINTKKTKEDPTTINKAIRNLANIFTKSNYVGFTATPFANIFIDPETDDSMETQDLFPEDFIVALPTPSNYIGPTKIFSPNGPYYTQLTYIEDAGREEEDGWSFYFKHKKDWEDYLPNSLTDALYTFYLANSIRDLRGDVKAHRSMLVNVSRFVKVQYHIKNEIEHMHERAYRAVKFNLTKNREESLKDPIIKRIYSNWKKYYSHLEFTWDEISKVLFSAIEDIQIRVVNSSRASEKLIYPENDSLRVIAVGGLALSRGLTLEGLIISYFYRNTCTYDVLMQMGRWFGYRRNYDDLFRIWIYKESAEWYEEIAEATEQLKDDMSLMRELELKPKDFGIRVRNNSSKLRITAANKMRNADDEFEYESYFGGIIETPYVIYDAEIQRQNYKLLDNWVDSCVKKGCSVNLENAKGVGKHNVMHDVNKSDIVRLLRQFQVSRFSSSFDTTQICEFLGECTDGSIDQWNVAFMDGVKSDDQDKYVTLAGTKIYKVTRGNCKIDTATSRLSIGQRGKLGGTNDGLLGIEDVNGKCIAQIVEDAKESYRKEYKKDNLGKDMPENKSFPSETWFKYIEDRKPEIIIYLIDAFAEESQKNNEGFKRFKNDMGQIPIVCLAMGLPKNKDGKMFSKNRYKVNKVYNWFEKDQILAEGEEE